MKTKSNPEKSISAKALCAFTGLTDRRHRQLAEAGYFPPPANGLYAHDAALAGLFKYFRERAKGADPLTQARLAKVESETELNNLTIAERKRHLAPVTEVIAVVGKFISSARERILSDPHLEPEDKDKICLDLCAMLDAACGMQNPQVEPEDQSKAQSATTD